MFVGHKRQSPDPMGKFTVLPRLPSWIRGSLFLREWDGKGVEEGVRGGERRGREIDG